MKYPLLAALIAQGIVSFSSAKDLPPQSCKDENGNEVDWFIIYKLPRSTLKSVNPTGGKFAYVDSENSKKTLEYWPISQQDLFKNSNPIAYTLRSLYERTTSEDILYFAYNDEPPKTSEGKWKGKGHSKGVVLFDKTAGFWLLHSVPKFMKGLKSGQYVFPENAKNNGQMFVCFTFRTEQVEKIDLFADELFMDLKERIVVQSWMNGNGGKYLSADDVNHVVAMELKSKENKIFPFETTVDHSKWAFTNKSDIFCLASTNRKPSQEKRGGEALCFNNRVVKDLFCSGVKYVSSEAIVTHHADRKRPRCESSRRKA
nr:deoxyribonuclease-2-beta-like isoform X2 [Rhipicephalus microplus]